MVFCHAFALDYPCAFHTPVCSSAFPLCQYVGIRRFNQTSPVHNTAIERHLVDLNMVTRKWKQEFLLLEAAGVFQVCDAGATFSLIAVYGPLIESDVNGHYLAMRQRKKRRSTCNPNYPKKTQRRWELYSLYHSRLTPLTSDELSRVREVGRLHSAGAGRSTMDKNRPKQVHSWLERP